MDLKLLVPSLLLILSPLAQAQTNLDTDGLPSADLSGAEIPEASSVARDGDEGTGGLPVDLNQALSCEAAVRVTDRYWGGTVLDEEERLLAWTEPYTWTERETRAIPIIETVEVPALDTVPVIGGLTETLQLTQTVERVVGHEYIVEEVEHTVPITIELSLESRYVDWEREIHSWYVSPAGAPVAVAQGYSIEPTQACDRETIHLLRSDYERTSYDHYRSVAMSDGWMANVIDIDVRWATPAEVDTLPSRDAARQECPLQTWLGAQDDIRAHTDQLPAYPGQEAGIPSEADDSDEVTTDSAGLTGSTGANSSSMIAAAASALVGVVAAVGFAMRRFW